MATEETIERLRRLFPSVDPENTFSASDFLHVAGSPAQAILAAVGLFFPALRVVEGSVLLARAIETDADRQRFVSAIEGEMDRSKAEESFNMVEVSYAFGTGRDQTTEEDDEFLANLVCQGWKSQLQHLHPERAFSVKVVPPQESGSVAAVTFCEAPNL